jgi:hypothetical protein
MPIKKYTANKDTTITDAYKFDLTTRAENSNMGAADSLEIFSIYGQASNSSLEKSRVLVQFPIEDIITDRVNTKIPASGSVKFYLKLYNVEHSFSVPRDFSVTVNPINQAWDEGYGLDMESYSDDGWNTYTAGSGCTWLYATSGSSWTGSNGGSFLTASSYTLTQNFSSGLEDLDVDVTEIVEKWINSTIPNYGFIVKLSGSFEDGTQKTSFYTKKFSARGTEYFFKKPSIEARWAAVVTDDRNNFFASSSAFSDSDNIMNLYFFNKPRGVSKNIVGNILPGVKFYSDSSLSNEISSSYKVITNPSAGVYKVQTAIDTTASVLYDKWYNTSSLVNYFSSSFEVLQPESYDYDYEKESVFSITNMKVSYSPSESARFKIFSRKKDWSPTIYSVANNIVENDIINNLYYKIFRLSDNYLVLDYSTGSVAFSKTSYDSVGNYFDLDMSLLESGYTYGFKFATYDGVTLKELPQTFKFKVE